MPDTTTTPDISIDTDVEPDPTTDADLDPDGTETDVEQEPTGRAAKLRARAQQAETERDTATAMVDTLRRAEVARLAADKLAAPEDLFTYGDTTPADLVDDDGLIDPEKVTAAVDALLEARPGLAKAALRKPVPGTYANQGQFQPVQRSGRRKTNFADIF